MDEPSVTEPVSISNLDQSKSAVDESAIDDPSVSDNTVVQGADKDAKEEKGEDASKAEAGSEGKTDLSANPDG